MKAGNVGPLTGGYEKQRDIASAKPGGKTPTTVWSPTNQRTFAYQYNDPDTNRSLKAGASNDARRFKSPVRKVR